VSLGQLDEAGYHISIQRGLLRFAMIDDGGSHKLGHDKPPLHLELEIEQLVSLSTRTEEVSWRWHARYGHLSFLALQKLHKEEMVHGLPAIEGVNRLCDGCLISKQRRTPFPSQASYRTGEPLELVHNDICGHIKLATLDSKTLFLMLADDKKATSCG